MIFNFSEKQQKIWKISALEAIKWSNQNNMLNRPEFLFRGIISKLKDLYFRFWGRNSSNFWKIEDTKIAFWNYLTFKADTTPYVHIWRSHNKSRLAKKKRINDVRLIHLLFTEIFCTMGYRNFCSKASVQKFLWKVDESTYDFSFA